MSSLSALREECEEVSQFASGLAPKDFELPTRCSEWNVKELLGHIYRDVDRIKAAIAEPAPAEATHDSATYFLYDAAEMAPGVAERAKEVAGRFPTGASLVTGWDSMWPPTLATADAELVADPERIVTTWGPALTLEEYLRTRVLEVTVHRMDLEEAFGRKCWGTDEAVGIVDEILVDLLGKEPPHELEWDAIDFIETACGRRELTGEERSMLGVRAATKFPLIG